MFIITIAGVPSITRFLIHSKSSLLSPKNEMSLWKKIPVAHPSEGSGSFVSKAFGSFTVDKHMGNISYFV